MAPKFSCTESFALCPPNCGRTKGKAVRAESGFTLIELLVTCSILAALAGLGWAAYAGIHRQTDDELVRVELLRLASAIRVFHEDTGYWPGEGVFQLADAGCGLSSGGGVDPASLPTQAATNPDNWFNDPANLTLLFHGPTLCAAHPQSFLGTYNTNTRRGWNGPYLPVANRRLVNTATANGVPALGTRTFHFLHEAGLPPRVVYPGADGRFGTTNPIDSCLPNPADPNSSDDVVICP